MLNHLSSIVTIVDSKEHLIEEYYGLKLIPDDIFNLIEYFPDDGYALCDLIKPSQINSFTNSDFHNVEKEMISFTLFGYCMFNGDKFEEIDINQITQPKINEDKESLKFLLYNGYLTENGNGKFVITNKYIKIFFKNGIFNLKKAKEKEAKDLERKNKIIDEGKIYKGVFDTVMQLYLYIVNIDKPKLNNLYELKNYIEQKTNGVLTLKIFEKSSSRSCWDVFIAIKGVTFESHPLISNISVGYEKGRSYKSLEEAVSNFVSWINTSEDIKFIKELALDLKIDIDNSITDIKNL